MKCFDNYFFQVNLQKIFCFAFNAIFIFYCRENIVYILKATDYLQAVWHNLLYTCRWWSIVFRMFKNYIQNKNKLIKNWNVIVLFDDWYNLLSNKVWNCLIYIVLTDLINIVSQYFPHYIRYIKSQNPQYHRPVHCIWMFLCYMLKLDMKIL